MSPSPSGWLLNLPYQTSPACVFGSFSVAFSTTGFWDPAFSFQFWSCLLPCLRSREQLYPLLPLPVRDAPPGSGLGPLLSLICKMPKRVRQVAWSIRLSRDGVNQTVCAPDREVFSLVDFHKSWLPLVWVFLELAVIWSPTWKWDISTQRHGSKSGYALGKN